MIRSRTIITVILILMCAMVSTAFAEGGVRKVRPRPYLYGSVVMATTSVAAKVPSVAFDHWSHRNRFTCRLCHIDLNFAMTTGDTRVRAADNERGTFCGACHNGQMKFGEKPLFAACRSGGNPTAEPCTRCHAPAESPQREQRFLAFSAGLPRERLGNGIDWEKSEVEGKIRLTDSLEGISVKRKPLGVRENLDLTAKLEGMPEIIFSHKKHTNWSGCELCHPDIFIGVKQGTTRYTMVDLFGGRYCGACHDKVAFPQSDCQRCHTKPVM